MAKKKILKIGDEIILYQEDESEEITRKIVDIYLTMMDNGCWGWVAELDDGKVSPLFVILELFNSSDLYFPGRREHAKKLREIIAKRANKNDQKDPRQSNPRTTRNFVE